MARTPPLGSSNPQGPMAGGPLSSPLSAPISSGAPGSGAAPTVPDSMDANATGGAWAPARTMPKVGGTFIQGLPAPPASSSGPFGTTRPAAPTGVAVHPTMLGGGDGPPPSAVIQPPPSPSPGPTSDYRQQSIPDVRNSLTSGSQILPKLCTSCGMRYPAEFRVCPKDAGELVDAEEDQDELIGRTLAETYTIVRVVGEGGMGRVYEARHTRIGGKRFAVKLLHPEYARMPEVLSRFQREAEAAASIGSQHVGDVYDIGRTADGRPFIVAEFLEGRELADFLRERGRLDVAYAVRLVRQICKALAAAHAKGIVHRDMKPENVFLTGDLSSPVAKVIDFGISKVKEAGGGPSLTKTGMIMGTPSYMAPEQAKGEKVDHRVDIYATGAILYELVTGKRPFDRVDPTATIMAVLLEEPERPCVLNPSLPEALEMVIQRAMAKAADARYQSMLELDADLANFAAPNQPASIMPPPMLANGVVAPAPRGAMEARERDVAFSRPTIAILGALGAFGVMAGLTTVVAASIRISRGGGAAANVTGSESLLLLLLLTLALATPLGFGVHYVRKNVWSNSAKTVELANAMRRSVVSAFVAYGLASMTIRFTEALLLRRAVGVAWPVWEFVLVLIAVAAGAGSHFLLAERRR